MYNLLNLQFDLLSQSYFDLYVCHFLHQNTEFHFVIFFFCFFLYVNYREFPPSREEIISLLVSLATFSYIIFGFL